MRIGFSKDIHILKEGVPLILGGVQIPYEFGLESHSDGDCLTHAIVEAIFGALNVGDLGKHFPPNDDRYKGVSSLSFLDYTKKLLSEKHYEIENLDCFISCEKPKLKDFLDKIREKISGKLGISIDQISIKAGTNEGVGPVGEKKAIEAYCVVLLKEVKWWIKKLE